MADRKENVPLRTFYVTCGNKYVADAEQRKRTGYGEQHPTFPIADRDGYVIISAYDEQQAREFAAAAFPNPDDSEGVSLYAFMYDENPNRAPHFFYPKGCLARIGIFDPEQFTEDREEEG